MSECDLRYLLSFAYCGDLFFCWNEGGPFVLNFDNFLHLFVLTFCLVLDTFFWTQIPRDFREGPDLDFPFSFVRLHRLQPVPVPEARQVNKIIDIWRPLHSTYLPFVRKIIWVLPKSIVLEKRRHSALFVMFCVLLPKHLSSSCCQWDVPIHLASKKLFIFDSKFSKNKILVQKSKYFTEKLRTYFFLWYETYVIWTNNRLWRIIQS